MPPCGICQECVAIDVLGPIDAAADEGKAGAIEHHHADAGAIGEIFEAHTDQEVR